MKKIQILGTGCAKCENLADLAKQAAGASIGLSATTTFRAPTSLHIRITHRSTSGFAVAPRCGPRSNPTLGLIKTTSPLQTNRLIPCDGSSPPTAARTSFSTCRPLPVAMLIRGLEAGKSILAK